MSDKQSKKYVDDYLTPYLEEHGFDTTHMIEHDVDQYPKPFSQPDTKERAFLLYAMFEHTLKTFHSCVVSGRDDENDTVFSLDKTFVSTAWQVYFEKYHELINQIMIDCVEAKVENSAADAYVDFARSDDSDYRLLRTASEAYKMILLGFGTYCFNNDTVEDDESVYVAQKMLSVVIHVERAKVLCQNRPMREFATGSVWIDWLCMRSLKACADAKIRCWADGLGPATICDAITELPDVVKIPFSDLLLPCFPRACDMSAEMLEKMDEIVGERIKDQEWAVGLCSDKMDEETEAEADAEADTETEAGVVVSSAAEEESAEEQRPASVRKWFSFLS
jgi:hypothetical protein